MTKTFDQRAFALRVLQQLRGAGYEALWAGGCVRDQLLGKEPEDYDVATSARPEEVQNLFGSHRTLAIGAAFGVVAVLGKHKQPPIEVATFRSDGAYVDGRRPEGIVYTTAEQDAQRRDFTINGLFYDPIDQRVIDYVDGEHDLNCQRLRAIGDPRARFSEDKLRMLRAVRFATTLGFHIEEETFQAIREMADEVRVVSAERIGTELRRMLTHPHRAEGVRLLCDTHLLMPLLPELAKVRENTEAWQRTLRRLDQLASDSLAAALAALLLETDAKTTRAAAQRLRYANRESDRAAWLVQTLPQLEHGERLPWPRLQRLLIHKGSAELLALAEAQWGSDHLGVKTCRERLALPLESLNPPALLSGEDLIELGLSPGPMFSALLEQIRDEQLEGRLNDRAEASEYVRQWLETQNEVPPP